MDPDRTLLIQFGDRCRLDLSKRDNPEQRGSHKTGYRQDKGIRQATKGYRPGLRLRICPKKMQAPSAWGLHQPIISLLRIGGEYR